MNSQPDLFHIPVDRAAMLNNREHVCRLVMQITEGRSRARIADDMTRLGHRTSKAMIDAWASPTREAHNIPFYQVPALEIVCRSTLLTDWDVSLHGGVACYGEEALRREVAAALADLEVERAEFTRRINELRKKMGRA